MQKSYTNNYFKIYFWQAIAIVLNILSLFIVIPKLSGIPNIYGIYTVCISATIFLSYADLGFLSACFKYASESYAKNEKAEEIKITAFGIFILFVFVLIIALVFLTFSINPGLLIKGLTQLSEIKIASRLLLILSLFTFTIVIQRLLQIIFGIRLKDYKYQRINIIGSIIKISSIFYFFRNGNYDIVGYFLFIQLMNLIASLIGLWSAIKEFDYDIFFFIKNFRYSKNIYIKTKGLAFSSLVATILWILYYEIDAFAIAKLLGTKQVAFFAVGFTLMTFLRTIFGTVYTPFNARFNHLVGTGEIEKLKSIYLQVIMLTLPVVLLPVIGLIIFMKLFVFSWVGYQYEPSINIGIFLLSCYFLSFISYPAGILMTALEKIKQIYYVNFLILIIYWGGIFITINKYGIQSFAFFKFIAFIIAGLWYFVFSAKFIKIPFLKLLKKIFSPAILPLIIYTLLLVIIKKFIPITDSKIGIVYILLVLFTTSAIFAVLYYFTSKVFKEYSNQIFYKIRNFIFK